MGTMHLPPASTQPDAWPGTERRPAAEVLKQHHSPLGAMNVQTLQPAWAPHLAQQSAAEDAFAE